MSGLRVVFLGVIGSGKTTLFNKLTSNNELVREGGESVTKQVVVGTTNIGEQFEIVDTPGFEADEDKLLHAAGVVAALSIGDVNRILVISKFERDGRMLSALQQVIAPINRFRDMITILVSHWDLSENKDGDKQNLIKKIKFKFNIDSVLFYSKNDDTKNIVIYMDLISYQSKFRAIKLQDTEIYSQFDLLILSYDQQSKLDQNKVTILKNFRRVCIIFIDYINNITNLDDSKILDILHYLSLEIKKIANQQIEEFERQHGEEINNFYDVNGNNVRYLHHIYLKKEISKDVQNVIKLAQSKMTQSQNHYFQFVKQCPYCKLIWIKVAGCDGKTTCGNRVNLKKDKLLKADSTPTKFKYSIKEGKLIIEENDEAKNKQILKEREAIDNKKKLYQILKANFNLEQIFGQNIGEDQLIDVISNKFGMFSLQLYMIYKFSDFDEEALVEQFSQMLDIFRVKHDKKYFGCGGELVWSELAPLSGPELNELLSIELIDYFSDQQELISDESKFLEKIYKELVNQAIQDQFKNKKILQQKQQQQQQQ